MFLPVITGLQKFSVDMARKRASIPKYQVYNNALLSVLSGLSFKEAVTDSKRWGQFFESAIGAYIISEAFVHRFEVYYWREGNDEVDFVLKKNQKIVAIEVKSNGETKTTGMARFHKLFNPLATIVVGENGIQPELFLSMDLRKLFE